jgi:hypothetical protein
MKPATPIIAVSLVVNAVLGVLLLRPSPLPEAIASSDHATQTEAAAQSARLRAALASGDFAALCAAGVPLDTARALASGHAYARYRAKLRAIQPVPDLDPRFWRASGPTRPPLTPDERAALTQAEREFSDTLSALFGDGASLTGTRDLRLSFLPAWKQELVRRIEQDFDDLTASLRRDITGPPLAFDRERQRQLLEQKEHDLAALLTPAERDALELRASSTALNLMDRFGDGLATEDDWRMLFSAFKARDERFPSDLMLAGTHDIAWTRASNEDTRRTYEQIHQALGDERFAALQRAVDSDRQDLASLGRRLALPPDATERVLTLRETYALESQRIADDESLDDTQRTTQLKALAARARDEVTPLLGPAGTDAYARRPNWMRQLADGHAYTTNPADTSMGPSGLMFYRNYPWSPPVERQSPPKS